MPAIFDQEAEIKKPTGGQVVFKEETPYEKITREEEESATKLNSARARFEADFEERRKTATAETMATAMSPLSPVGRIVLAPLLRFGGAKTDMALGVGAALTGAVSGTFLGGTPGTIAGGAAGAGAGNALVQARQMVRGERKDFSNTEFLTNTAVGALPLPAIKAAATPLMTVAKTMGVRGLQGAGLGGAQETIRQGYDEDDYDFGHIGKASLMGFGVGAVFGGVEKGGLLLPKETHTALREKVVDSFIRMRQLQNKTGIKVGDESNVSDMFTVLPGRASERLAQSNKFAETYIEETIKAAKETSIDPKVLAKEVNEYLQAVHAPERNAVLGDGAAGMTNAEASDTLLRLANTNQWPKIQALAQGVREVDTKILDVLLDGQVISRELYDTLKAKYPNHVSLNRIMQTDDDVGRVLTGGIGSRNLDVKGTGIIRAVGSEREVDDIAGNVITNYQQAVIRAEKNRVDLGTLKFARDNADLGLFTEIRPKAIGRAFAKEGEEGRVLMDKIDDPQVLHLREKGEPVYLHINDPQLAVALRGVNRETVNGVLRYVGGFTRLFSSLATRYNPEFAPVNKVRDLQESVVFMGAQKGLGVRAGARAAARDPINIKDVVQGLRGKDTEGATLYRQMREDGGTTGGMGFSSRETVRENLDDIWKTAQSRPRRAMRKTLQLMDDWNTVFEDSTRLGIYRESLKSGMSRQKAAALAKEGTIDFNRMGTAGPLINALWMFSNASIQGSAKMMRSMRNPKVAASVVGGVTTAVILTDQWNRRIDPDWKTNPNISDWDKINGLPILLPTEDGRVSYFTMPVSWGIKPIKVAADHMLSLSEGKGNPMEAASQIATAVIEGYNPVGGTDFAQAITPTILDPIVDIARNRKWTGGRIKPDNDPYAPESTKYFPNLEQTPSGRLFIGATKGMSADSQGAIEISPADIDYALNTMIGGAGRFAGKVFNTTSKLASDEAPAMRDIPFASRFLRSVEKENVGKYKPTDPRLIESLREQSRDRFYNRKNAEHFVASLEDMTPDERINAVDALDEATWNLVKPMLKKEASGLTAEELKIKNLGDKNGARAKYIYDTVREMKDEERADYILNLIDKRIATPNVQSQLAVLLHRSPPP